MSETTTLPAPPSGQGPLTEDSAIIQIQAIAGGLTADDIKGLSGCTPFQLIAILKAYQDDQIVPQISTWDTIANILKQVPSYAPVAEAIIGVVASLIAL